VPEPITSLAVLVGGFIDTGIAEVAGRGFYDYTAPV
jgi:hypothetical protein